MENKTEKEPRDFIRQIIEEDVGKKRDHPLVIRTRFPPEPNGYLHIGHAKAICLNFEIAKEFGGTCNLRFDDTNPSREDRAFTEAIIEDVRWLGYDWGERLFYSSDYFEQMHQWALELIDKGLAYVDELSQEEVGRYRGTPTTVGKESPFRTRPIAENRRLFEEMRIGKFSEGSCLLRAKIDMSHPNVHMRDPVLYRIKKAEHYRRKASWCIYPMYDFAHGYEDAIEGITHSLCTLEFENHRPLYNWLLEHVSVPSHPRQIEFARLNLSHTVTSKRTLKRLVDEKVVKGWDDPRMPTLAGMRRLGIPPSAIRALMRASGVTKVNSTTDVEYLYFFVREELNATAPRRMAVLRPLKVVITNYPEEKKEFLEAENLPDDPSSGSRKLPFSREIYIEREDFSEDPPPKYFRLAPGREVRLKHAYYLTCEKVVHDEMGHPKTLLCRYDPNSRGGWSSDGRKVRGTLNWVEASSAIRGEVRLFESLFTFTSADECPEDRDILTYLNPHSQTFLTECLLEPSLGQAAAGERFQFLRHGYFCSDSHDHQPRRPVFNRIASLRDSWEKIKKNQKQRSP